MTGVQTCALPICDVRLTGFVEGDSSGVTGDAGLLSRALQNIIGNAIAYTRPGTEVTVVVFFLILK